MKLIKKLPTSYYVIYSAIIAIGILLDQLTKWLAVVFLMPVDTVPLLKGALHLTYVENRGAAFGMLADHRWVFMVVSTVTIVAIAIALFTGHIEGLRYGVCLAAIISGGIGNMIDRVALGYVIDFIDFRLINFAVFNGADSFVCVGAGFMILFLVLDIVKEAKENKK